MLTPHKSDKVASQQYPQTPPPKPIVLFAMLAVKIVVYNRDMNNKTNKSSVLLPAGIIIGALIGSAMGMLLSPSSGKQNRKKLKDLSMKLKGDLERDLSEMKDVTEDSYKKAVDTIVMEYSKKEPLIKENAKKLKNLLKGKFKHQS